MSELRAPGTSAVILVVPEPDKADLQATFRGGPATEVFDAVVLPTK